MPQNFYRDSWVEVNLDNVAYNIRQLRQRLSNKTNIFAVVKANAYGHGDVEVAEKALQSGADRLAVSLLDEAVKLRNNGIKAPILVMGRIRPEDAPVAADYDISITFYQREWLRTVKQAGLPGKLKLHMKWDTGMGRIGIRQVDELEEILGELTDDRLVLEGLYTHFATADEQDLRYFEQQQDRFDRLLAAFRQRWDKPVLIHTGNSAASMRFPDKMAHYVRYGISMYGLYPSSQVKEEKPIPLKQAFSLHSKLIHIKKLPAGESISYGSTYTTSGEEWIGTVPLGYADGLIRKLQGKEVLVEGKRFPIVGRICMDQFMVRLDGHYPVGTQVTIIGRQAADNITMDEVADYLETINYEVPCTIGHRVPRVYKENGEVKKVSNPLLQTEGYPPNHRKDSNDNRSDA
ncbi:alanine racemase [Sediminibacillus albus]|uniref:Alanine racemase n=1 Tax=Sediminibacillus albus TaxID=407036 RepID=A0A1G9AWZ3_9BACI|nr:alanine racemase [Sediminibacillus albus]SDK31135.1 alanine racemase [Sediminibacillus albus]